jgi:hypothetical protein
VSSVEVAVPVEVTVPIESVVAIESVVHYTPTWMASLEAVPGRCEHLAGRAHCQQDCHGGERDKCEPFWMLACSQVIPSFSPPHMLDATASRDIQDARVQRAGGARPDPF